MTVDAYLAGMLGDPNTMDSLRDGRSLDRAFAPTPGDTIFGINVTVIPGTTLADRLADFGRVPLIRGPYYSTGSTGTASSLPVTFDTSLTSRSPEKRAVISFQPATAPLLAGVYDSAIATWAESVPSDWWVGLCFFSEPNQEIVDGVITIADWKAACIHISQLLWSLTSKNRVVPSNVMSAPKGWTSINWVDSWMIPFEDMENDNAQWNWDAYGNPFGGGTSGTSLYGPYGRYPTVEATTDKSYNLLVSNGWTFEHGHWGYAEFNSPRRLDNPNAPPHSPYDNGDGTYGDELEVRRTEWIQDYCAYTLTRDALPHHIICWEGDGTQFNQKFYHDNVRNAYRFFMEGSA